jgi:hypothetical protein
MLGITNCAQSVLCCPSGNISEVNGVEDERARQVGPQEKSFRSREKVFSLSLCKAIMKNYHVIAPRIHVEEVEV